MKKIIVFALLLITSLCLFTFQASAETATGVNVKDFGATGNGQTDDTAAIQRVLNSYDSVYIPDGTYLINADQSLAVKSNQTIILSPNAVLQALPSANGYYNIIKIAGVSNVTISGGQIVGERFSHLGSGGEWGSGILICSGAENISISNITVSNCWGDGFLVGDNATSNNIRFDSVVADNNRRQGMSICSATNVTVSNSVFKNSNGTAPQSGIDVEPNPGSMTKNIVFSNVECFGNAGRGLSLSGCLSTYGMLSDVTITNSTIHDNGQGLYIETAKNITCSNTICSKNENGIKILRDTTNAQFLNMTVCDNSGTGFLLCGNNQKVGIDGVTCNSSSFFNNSKSKAGTYDGAMIYSDLTGYIQNIAFSECKFYDSQTLHTQGYGFNLSSTARNSTIALNIDCTYSGNVKGSFTGITPSSFTTTISTTAISSNTTTTTSASATTSTTDTTATATAGSTTSSTSSGTTTATSGSTTTAISGDTTTAAAGSTTTATTSNTTITTSASSTTATTDSTTTTLSTHTTKNLFHYKNRK